MNIQVKHVAALLSVLLPPALVPSRACGQEMVSVPANALGSIQVQSISVAEVSQQGVGITVTLALTPARSVTVESVRLSSLRMNGLPLYAAPLTAPLELTKGKPATLPPLTIKALFRDLNSVAPLRKMLDEESVHVQGQAEAAVRIGFLEKLALHTEHPVISFPINADVPVSIEGPPFARQAAVVGLTLVQTALESGVAAGKRLPGMEPEWIAALTAKSSGALVEVETHYAITEKGISYPVVLDQIGFRLAGAPVLTTIEAKTPWEYDPEFLGRIRSGEAKLDAAATDLQIVPLSGDSGSAAGPLELSQGDFTLQERGAPEQEKLLVQSKGVVSVKVKRRASPNALLVLLPTRPEAGAESFAAAAEDVMHQDRWEKLAVFRLLSPAGTAGAKPDVEVIQLSGHRGGKSIQFEQPVDAAAFGSPIMTPEGVIGIVQDETSGAFLPADMAAPRGAH